jgi:hypothetical protein
MELERRARRGEVERGLSGFEYVQAGVEVKEC